MKKKIFKFTVILFLAVAFICCKNDTPEAVYYNVVFDSNGGSAVQTQKVKSGKKATKPQDPEKTTGNDKYFGEWYEDPELTTLFDFSTSIKKDIILYAKWLTIPLGSYLVTFDSKTDTEISTQIVKGGEKAQEPDNNFTKDGYAFSHWYVSDENQEFNFAETPITAETNFTAKWNKSGIHEATFEEEAFFTINLYDDIEMDSQSDAW